MFKNIKEYIYINNINLYYLRENYLLFLKFILISYNSQKIKINAYNCLMSFFINKKSIKCLLSSRGKSINSSLFLSRILLRKLIYEGLLLGFKKSSW